MKKFLAVILFAAVPVLGQTSSRDIVAEASDYFSVGSALVSGPPLTMSIWFYGDVNQGINRLMNITDTAVTKQYIRMLVNLDDLQCTAISASEGNATTTGDKVSEGTWHHLACVFESSTMRRAYVDGVQEATNTTNLTPTGLDTTSVGALVRTGVNDETDGRIVDAALWDAVLGADEIAALAGGVVPAHIRPGSLVGYWPLREPDATSDALDVSGGGNTLTSSGDPALATASPPVFVPMGGG